MDKSNFIRIRQFVGIAAAIVTLGLLVYAIRLRGIATKPEIAAVASQEAESKTGPTAVALTNHQPLSTSAPDRVLQINPDAVLASINGHALRAADVLPPGASNQPVALNVCEYFLQRAIDRELIFQTARARGLELDESQKQQIANFETMHGQSGPGVVRNLNGGAAQSAFELRDAEAFMLQTSLLEQSGASPNVTSDQVLDYYQKHASDFGELPVDEQARKDAWANIDFAIRQQLASGTRSDFQNRLTEYMNYLKSQASIQLTPLTTFAGAR